MEENKNKGELDTAQKEAIKRRELEKFREYRQYSEERKEELWQPEDKGYSTTKYRMGVFTTVRGSLRFMIRNGMITDAEVIEKQIRLFMTSVIIS